MATMTKNEVRDFIEDIERLAPKLERCGWHDLASDLRTWLQSVTNELRVEHWPQKPGTTMTRDEIRDFIEDIERLAPKLVRCDEHDLAEALRTALQSVNSKLGVERWPQKLGPTADWEMEEVGRGPDREERE